MQVIQVFIVVSNQVNLWRGWEGGLGGASSNSRQPSPTLQCMRGDAMRLFRFIVAPSARKQSFIPGSRNLRGHLRIVFLRSILHFRSMVLG